MSAHRSVRRRLVEARNRSLPDWFDRLRLGQVRLPRFQRFEAWDNNEVTGLIDSVLKGLPSGATLVLEVGDSEPFISRVVAGAPQPIERANEHLLDGQQRLTALWRSLHDDYPDRTYLVRLDGLSGTDEDPAIPLVLGQPRWVRNGQRYPVWVDSPVGVRERQYVPLRLLCPGDLMGEVRSWCTDAERDDSKAVLDLMETITPLRQAIATYNIPYLSLPVTTPKHIALEVFIKMNTSSVRLTAFDIVVAQLEEETGQSLHDLMGQLHAAVPNISAYRDPNDLVLDVASLREDRSPTQASYQRLELQRVHQDWADIVSGIGFAVSLLEDEKVFDSDRLPTVVVLPVLAALYAHAPKALDGLGNARVLLRSYLWRSFLTRRYEQSAATRSLQDYRGLRDALQGNAPDDAAPIFDESQYPLPNVDELMRVGWPKTRDILARGILAVSILRGALDLADGAPATRATVANREYHHIFPDAVLTNDGGLTKGETFKALNCALITWNTNRNISAKTPLKYLRERVERATLGEDEIRQRLATHLIPYDELSTSGTTWSDPTTAAEHVRGDYEAFLHARAELLLPVIQALCDGKAL
ncbi:MAG: GmrSD restriction endonuclease domain-containing protein [Acidimicrobiales bacterium]